MNPKRRGGAADEKVLRGSASLRLSHSLHIRVRHMACWGRAAKRGPSSRLLVIDERMYFDAYYSQIITGVRERATSEE
jgi:hypothetical protein